MPPITTLHILIGLVRGTVAPSVVLTDAAEPSNTTRLSCSEAARRIVSLYWQKVPAVDAHAGVPRVSISRPGLYNEAVKAATATEASLFPFQDASILSSI